MWDDPTPRVNPLPYTQVSWPLGDRTQLTPREDALHIDLVSLIEQRETRRDFAHPVSLERLAEFLWLACRNRSSRPSCYGPDQESRAHPSAGAMHPVHVLVSRGAGPWERYDPVGHALFTIPGSCENATHARTAAASLVPVDQGVVLGMVAEPGKTAAKYRNGESLVWRDVGVVLGYMSIVAEALNLSFCPLGITGHRQLGELVSPSTMIQGAGLAVLGSR